MPTARAGRESSQSNPQNARLIVLTLRASSLSQTANLLSAGVLTFGAGGISHGRCLLGRRTGLFGQVGQRGRAWRLGWVDCWAKANGCQHGERFHRIFAGSGVPSSVYASLHGFAINTRYRYVQLLNVRKTPNIQNPNYQLPTTNSRTAAHGREHLGVIVGLFHSLDWSIQFWDEIWQRFF